MRRSLGDSQSSLTSAWAQSHPREAVWISSAQIADFVRYVRVRACTTRITNAITAAIQTRWAKNPIPPKSRTSKMSAINTMSRCYWLASPNQANMKIGLFLAPLDARRSQLPQENAVTRGATSSDSRSASSPLLPPDPSMRVTDNKRSLASNSLFEDVTA